MKYIAIGTDQHPVSLVCRQEKDNLYEVINGLWMLRIQPDGKLIGQAGLGTNTHEVQGRIVWQGNVLPGHGYEEQLDWMRQYLQHATPLQRLTTRLSALTLPRTFLNRLYRIHGALRASRDAFHKAMGTATPYTPDNTIIISRKGMEDLDDDIPF